MDFDPERGKEHFTDFGEGKREGDGARCVESGKEPQCR